MSDELDESREKRLRVVEAGAQEVRRMPPLSETHPSSRRVLVGELAVPFREIELGGGEPPLRVYETSGPDNPDPRQGLPRLRQSWIDGRLRASDGNVTQLHWARRGIITEEQYHAVQA